MTGLCNTSTDSAVRIWGKRTEWRPDLDIADVYPAAGTKYEMDVHNTLSYSSFSGIGRQWVGVAAIII